MLDSLRRARRSFRVVRTGARIYFGYKRSQRRVRGMTPAAAAAEWERRHEESAELLYRLAVDLKGMYIKAAQFIGTRSDVAPPAYVRSLSRLQDRVPPRPATEVRATIEREFGRGVHELFATFDDTPLGAASLAQVHRATLHDGRQVVVKVQYPEVGALVRLDIRNLKTIVGFIARREPNFDYRAVVSEVGTQVPLELDFVRESEMTQRVRANLAALPNVVVPRVAAGLVREKVLVTEYLEGAHLHEVARIDAMGTDRAAFAQTVAEAYAHQIMVDGLFQADPHPGNILVLPGGRLALLDFGLTKELPERARLGFARLVAAAGERDAQGILAAFDELGVRVRSNDPAEVVRLMRIFFGARAPREDGPALTLGDRNRALNRTPVEAIPGDLVLLGRVIGLLRGVCASLGSPLTPMEMLRPHAEQVLSG